MYLRDSPKFCVILLCGASILHHAGGLHKTWDCLVLCALPALILGSGKFDIGQYFSFKLQYFQDNLYMILFMGAIFGVMRIIGAIGLLKNRMWGLALSVINDSVNLFL